MQHGRDNAGRAVGRRRDYPAAGRVFLVDRHRVQVHPVHDRQGIGQRALGALRQVAVEFGRAAAHAQGAGQFAVSFRVIDAAAARYAVLHNLPDAVQAGVHLGLVAPGQLVLHHELGDRQPAVAAHGQQFAAHPERIGQLVMRGDDLAVRCARRHDEAAAHRQVAGLAQRLALGVERVKLHAVRMLRHGLTAVEHHMFLFHERDGVAPEQGQLAAGPHRRDHAGNGGGIHGVGRLAHQSQQHALVGTVTLARRAQRPVKLGAHGSHARHKAVALQALGEQQGRPHGPHRMGARRAYANLEQVEYGNRHAKLQYI
ncbi:hypothetical protein D9M68_678240 [compost metagenome]